MSGLKNIISNLPTKPGIYKFSDKNDTIIYIGKAKSLKNRVSSYFNSKGSLPGKTSVMVKQICKIEYNIVASEYEALLLENSLIKKYQPKYNVLLKDGKTFPFIVIKKERFPRIFATRKIVKDGSEYFGPFVSVQNMNYLLDIIKKHFFIRTCYYNLSEENIRNKKFRVCLSYHIGICKGPCEGLQSEEEYNKNIESVRNILNGRSSKVIEYVREQIDQLVNKLEFEKANELKLTLNALKNYENKSVIVNPKISNTDVFSIYSNDNISVVNYLRIFNGSIIQTHTIEYRKQMHESDEDILKLAIVEIRERHNSDSKEIIVPIPLKINHDKFLIRVPKAGDKKKLLALSYKNALYYFEDIQRSKLQTEDKKEPHSKLLKKVKEDLKLNKVPYMMECFDISNIQGAFSVASMVAFKNGKPYKSGYRHFNIRTVKSIDDFASMQEVILRRYTRAIKEKQKLPDLIVIDGGKGQLSSAYKILLDLKLNEKIEIISIAKRMEEIFKPNETEPFTIDKRSPTLKLIQQIRNEAHRFGITHHRNRRSKETFISELEEIEGFGTKTVQKLLTEFKSLKKLRSATLEKLIYVVGKHKANVIFEYFNKTSI